ncbi:multidrug efflux RND transporter permease subunit [Agaricicola taiwanensis]|uniref:Efflux pump membrane transporter n=1 Tax=Agaricicola taiwanensis TaxID=591372 RepID=A0A8J2VMY9_9RHOB|nr:multidrug efflux RND transporter permease subunit [Agaricicola taiwanensis]GGE29620.1 multidrug efflux RND transporter permease subunit [Agaricicola taiwanensis]
MKFGHFFVDRPIFAAVLSIVLVIVGGIALLGLPIAQYPEIAPPTISINATYPGANAETIAETVATPIEQAVNGVEGMIYQSSQATSDGSLAITVTFEIGTDMDIAQVQVQNRVSTAEPRLPEEVRRLGVTVNKSATDFLMVVNMFSPEGTLDELYISNYVYLNIRDVIARLDGVGDLFVFGARELAVRVWLDPQRLASYGLTAGEVVAALQEENVQVSGGSLGEPPAPEGSNFQITVATQGRFQNISQFENVIVKRGEQGQLLKLKDIAKIEFGAQQYATNSYLDGRYSVGIGINQRPGSNALEAADLVLQTMEELKQDFPPGLEYAVVYNPTEFVSASIEAVTETMLEAVVLVVIVIFIFLQSLRTALIPILTIPVSLIGTFAVMAVFGFSVNMLTLFGLILAIGIVVDDAIVVVENVERNIQEGLTPREAAHRTMDEVGIAVIAIALVLSAVFIPTAFIPGISGRFYQQFAVTIAAATIVSAICSLTLSPALAALLIKPHEHGKGGIVRRLGDRFNDWFDRVSGRYARGIGAVVRRKGFFLLIYLGLVAATIWISGRVPTGFIPQSDQGYGIVALQLPEGASLGRTDEVVRRASEIIKGTPGVSNVVGIAGFNGATFSAASNGGLMFAVFEPFETRLEKGLTAASITQEAQMRLGAIQEAFGIVIQPPSVPGLGIGGGFKIQIQDRGNVGIAALQEATNAVIGRAAQEPRLMGVFSTFSISSPQVFVDVDRDKARMLDVPVGNIFQAMQILVGSAYVNDFSAYGRAFQVKVQADGEHRLEQADLLNIKVRSNEGALVPLGTLVKLRDTTGPFTVNRHNLFTTISITGSPAPGVSSGEALLIMEDIVNEVLPPGVGFEWTEIALQERQLGNAATYIFGLAVLFVFLVLAAQYESLALPLAIILIVPLAILAALTGSMIRGMDNNILTQIGFVVLIGLGAKNAILIVEFARQAEEEGRSPAEAVVEACRLRLRPILMTSLAFTLGVVPLALATGAGAELRQAIGTSVVFGMIGVTLLGLFLTPVFYVVIRNTVLRFSRGRPRAAPAGEKT